MCVYRNRKDSNGFDDVETEKKAENKREEKDEKYLKNNSRRNMCALGEEFFVAKRVSKP